jgi:hypothetical protein
MYLVFFGMKLVDVVSFGRKYFCNTNNLTKIIIQGDKTLHLSVINYILTKLFSLFYINVK